METKSILEMAQGAIAERADYEMARIISNILDPNTAATKKTNADAHNRYHTRFTASKPAHDMCCKIETGTD